MRSLTTKFWPQSSFLRHHLRSILLVFITFILTHLLDRISTGDYRGGRVVRLEFSWFREEMLEVSTLFKGVLFVVHIRSGLKVAWGWFSLDLVSCVVMP
ncbi:hypothetical protein Droror1_Dr00026125 [Drosera rotundifolia]